MEKLFQNKYYRIYLIGFFLILFLPVVNIQPLLSPPAWGKAILFRVILSILLYLAVYQIIRGNSGFIIGIKSILLNKKSKAFWTFWLLIAFAFWILVSTILSQDPFFSFWGSPQRAGGSLNLLFYILFFFLTFFIIKERDWQKLWSFAFLVGLLVSIISISQRFKLFSSILIPQTDQAVATMGNPILLGLYLLLLSFLSLSFAIKERGKKRVFYLACFILFVLNLFLTGSRASVLGFLIGLSLFVFLYPLYNKKALILKSIVAGILITLFLLLTLSNVGESLINAVKGNKVMGRPLGRVMETANSFLDIENFSVQRLIPDNRPSGWYIALQGVKERPLIGVGPENFSIVFDKHYNPSFSDLGVNSWWDRAHSFIFEIASTMGLPALLLYIAFFVTIYWQLQKMKHKEGCRDKVVIHGIQTTFIAYFIADLFSFEEVSTYIVLFFLSSYSLFLILKNDSIEIAKGKGWNLREAPLWKSGLIFLLFLIVASFIYFGALKPLFINRKINLANYYLQNKKCDKALEIMEEVESKESVLGSYLWLSYVDIVTVCEGNTAEEKLSSRLKLRETLSRAVSLMPTYTRTWWFLGSTIKFIINNKNNYQNKLNILELEKEASTSFGKAVELSPGRWQIFRDWGLTELAIGNYQKANEKFERCIDLDSNISDCYFNKGLSSISSGKIKEGELLIKIAEEKGWNTDEERSLNSTALAYSNWLNNIKDPIEKKEIYKKLESVYVKLGLHVANFQYHASLSFIYKELGKYDKAVLEAIKVFSLNPSSLSSIKEFIAEIPQKDIYYPALLEAAKNDFESVKKNSPELFENDPVLEAQYHGNLAFLYLRVGNYSKAKEEAIMMGKLNPAVINSVNAFINSLPK